MGVIVRGIKYEGRLKFAALNGIGGKTIDFLTNAGNILTQLDGVAINYPLLTNALPNEQVTYMIEAGTLPSGVSLNMLTGVISGTPAAVNDTTTYFFTVVAKKVGGSEVSRVFNITVNPNPQPVFAGSITDANGNPVKVADGEIEVIEFMEFAAYTNGITPKPGLTYAVTQGTLPTGLTLNAETGLISGTIPALTSAYKRSARVTLSSGTKSANINLSFNVIKNRAPSFTTATNLGSALGGGYFRSNIVATDADGEKVSISLSSGSSLPTGLTLVDGVISGNLPVATDANATYTFSLDATDGHTVVSKQFQIVALLNVNPVFKTAPAYEVLTGAPQTLKVEAIDPNSVNSIVLSRKSSTLPAEVTFDPATGNIVGAFTAPGSYNLVVEATNGQLTTEQVVTFTVAANLAPVWTTAAGKLGEVIGQSTTEFLLQATDPNGSAVTYSVVAGSLPAGLNLNGNRISGIANQVAAPGITSTFTIRASDGLLHTDREFSIYVDRNETPIWNNSVALGVAYEGELFTSPPLSAYDPDGQVVSISVPQNGLPEGWTYNPATSVVSGVMPSVAKNTVTAFTLTAFDGSSVQGAGTSSRRFEIMTLFNKMPVIDTVSLPKGVERAPYDFFLVARNPGNAGFTFSLVSGALPSGLVLSTAGRISGTLAEAAQDATYSFTVRVTNEIGSVERALTLFVEKNVEPVWQTPAGNLLTTLANNPISLSLAASDANGTPLVYTAKTPLPAGLTLSPAGLITGQTEVTQTESVGLFSVAVSDGVFNIERTFSITTLADSDPIWTTESNLGKILEGGRIEITLTASDPERKPLTYTLKSGALPSGVTFDAAQHRISGTAPEVTEDTTFDFEIEASDGIHKMSRMFSLIVENNVAPVWTTAAGSIGSFRSGDPLSFSFAATDANGTAITYSMISGTLPQGVLFRDGVLSSDRGTAIVLADTVYTFTLRASDGRFNTDRTFTITMLKNEPPVWISEGLLFEGNEGQSFSVELDWSDPEGDMVSVVQNGIPNGYTVVGKTLSSKLPSVSETTTNNITLSITDGRTAVARTFQIKTNFSSAPKWVTAPNLGTNLREGSAFSRQLQTNAGAAGATYAAKGVMPGSLKVSASGLITGNLPLIDVAQQNISFTITATNAFGSTDSTFTIGVVDNIEPVWNRPAGFVYIDKENTAFSIMVDATDVDDTQLTYSVVSGALPAGVTLDSATGAISGTLPVVTADTVYDFVLGVADNSVRVDRAYKIRAQNVMTFAVNNVNGVASPTTALMTVEGQIAGEWSSYKGLADRTITVTHPTTAILDHGRNIPNIVFVMNNVNGVASATTAGMTTNATENALFAGHLLTLNTTTSPGNSASMEDNAPSNAMFASSTVTPTTTEVAASSATQNT